MRAVTTRASAALLLLLLLVSAPLVDALPNQVGAIRLAGLSLLWWYEGVAVPILAALVAVAWLPDPAPRSRPE
jgi:hypothetical protein